MDPTMIEIGPFRIAWYGFFLTVAIFAAFEMAKRILKRWGHDTDAFEQAAFWAVVWGVIGARVGYVITSPGDFIRDPLQAFYIWQGGLSIHGAVVGGLLAFLYYGRRYGYPIGAYMDAVIPGIGVGIIAGRLGNYMNGSDTIGRLTNWPIGFTWPENSFFPFICKATGEVATAATNCATELVKGPVHLTQIYGALVGVIVLVLAYIWLRQDKPYTYVFWQGILWYSVLRFFIEEPFRLNPLWVPVYENNVIGFGFFTATQIISIPLIIWAIIALSRLKGGRPPTVAVPAPAPAAPSQSTKPKKKG